MRQRFGWVEGALFLGAITLVASAGTSPRDDQAYYMSLRKPRWAPPPWAFGVAWPVLNVLQVWSDLDLLNRPPSVARSRLLRLRGLNWVLFSIYTPAFFRLRSPAAGLIVSIAQCATAYATLAAAGSRFWKQSLSTAPLAAWTTYATALSEAVRARNPRAERLVPRLTPSG